MSSSTISPGISADEFQALEQKVLRAVDMIRKEREGRAAAETELAASKAEVADLQAKLAAAGSGDRASAPSGQQGHRQPQAGQPGVRSQKRHAIFP